MALRRGDVEAGGRESVASRERDVFDFSLVNHYRVGNYGFDGDDNPK